MNAQALSYLIDVGSPAVISATYATRHDRKPAKIRKPRRDILNEPKSQCIILLVIMRHTSERKNREQRSFWLSDLLSFFAFLSKRPSEPKASPRKGLDQPLILAIVSDGVAKRADAATNCRIGHEPATPNLGHQVAFADNALTPANE